MTRERALQGAPCPPKTHSDLEWRRVLEALAARCASDLARSNVLDLAFATTYQDTLQWAREGAEAFSLLTAGTPLPTASMPDPSETIAEVTEGGLLGSHQLRAMATLLEVGRSLRKFLDLHGAACPTLATACSTSPALDAVAATIGGCFESNGALADRASPRLRELRREEKSQRARIHTKLEQFMSSNEHFMHERFVTERDGCWVVPIKAIAVSRLKGTVHGASNTGSTVFFEPDAISGLTSKVRAVEKEVEREEHEIYLRLSALLCGVADELEACARAVARADLRAATAKLARDLRLEFPRIVDQPRIDLRNARHPLLVLDLGDAVASDLALAEGTCLVISGPNAGGKTVTLKTVGIAALMARAGLPIGCDRDSTIGLFDVVLTELGDEQSLSKNLSTFSAHMKNMAGVLERSSHGALVLLDELASGTDPREGEALASGLLRALCDRRAVVAVSTHYEGLKLLALNDQQRFRNASVGFDFATMRPTFRLHLGVPGGSSAFAVAERFGIPTDVLEIARSFLSTETVRFEQIVRCMNEERVALERASEAVRVSADALNAAHRDLATRASARESPLTTDGAPPEEPAPQAFVARKGGRVYLTRLGRNAEVIDVLESGNVRVLAGKLKVVVPMHELRGADD